MTSLNRSQDIPQVYEAVEKTVYADDKDKQDTEKSKVLLRMREGIFKSFVIIGYPKVRKGSGCMDPLPANMGWIDHQFASSSQYSSIIPSAIQNAVNTD